MITLLIIFCIVCLLLGIGHLILIELFINLYTKKKVIYLLRGVSILLVGISVAFLMYLFK